MLDTLPTCGNGTWRASACTHVQLLIEDSGNCSIIGMANDVLAGTNKNIKQIEFWSGSYPKIQKKIIKEDLQHFC